MKKLKKFVKSYNMIVLVLVLLCAFLMIYHIQDKKKNKLYVFGGYGEDITIYDGTIYTDAKMSRFQSSVMLYSGEEVVLKEYEVGFYINDDEVSLVRSEDDTSVKLGELLRITDFSFTEKKSKDSKINERTIKSIDKLEFRVNGKTDKDDEVSVIIKLDVKEIL